MPYEEVDWLVDRAHIADIVTQVYSAIDDGDFVTPITTVWSSGSVILDYGTPKDTTGKDIQATWHRQLGALSSTHHVITGSLIDLVSPNSATSVPTTASVRANVLASLTKDTGDMPLHQNGGVIHINLAKEGNGASNPWRITHFKARFSWMSGSLGNFLSS